MEQLRLSTLYAYAEQLSEIQREAFAEYLLSLNESREKHLKDVEAEADADWNSLVQSNPITEKLPTVREPKPNSVTDLFYKAVKEYDGVASRRIIFQYIKRMRPDLSDRSILSGVDTQAKKCGVQKTKDNYVWHITVPETFSSK